MNLETMKEYGESLVELSSFLPTMSIPEDSEAETAISWYVLGAFTRCVYCYADTVSEALSITSQIGGRWDKGTEESHYTLSKMVAINEGPQWKIEVNMARDKVCEKVQVGTRTIEKKDPTIEVPMILVEEPVYEWVCPDSLLAQSD